MLIFKVDITFICAFTFACFRIIISSIGARKNALTFAFTSGHIKVLIFTTIVDSSALTLASIMIKVVFGGAVIFFTLTFTNALLIQNLVWWTFCVWRAFTFAANKILDLWFFAKLEPTITVTNGLVKKFWKVTNLFI